jgi:D-alanine-D-alanine ligase
MSKIVVGVLRGGPSSEYEVSLNTGASVLKHLPEKYIGHDILISKDGMWHSFGVPRSPERVLKRVDVIFNALHGTYGEDGKVQQLLDQFSVPYTGSRALGSALGMNKALAKKAFEQADLKIPHHILIRKSDVSKETLLDIFKTFPHPYVVKPVSAGSSVGVKIARSFSELVDAVAEAFAYSPTVLIEELIRGREASCGVIEGFRGEKLYPLFPIEIIHPKSSDFFDYNAKYSGESQEICPANFNREVKNEIQRIAKEAHNALHLRHYSRSDFIISPRGVYILETNTLPGLTPESLLPKAVAAGGTEFPQFLDHLVTLALSRK